MMVEFEYPELPELQNPCNKAAASENPMRIY
jgi:hypothetical protein